MEHLLQTKGLCKTYSGIKVLRDINFDLLAGEVHALIGENGAGKSTFIKTITGVVEPDPGGEIFFEGKHIHKLTAAKARRMGISAVFQDLSLFPTMSIAENISSGSKLHGTYNKDMVEKTAQKLLDQIGVDLDVSLNMEDISVGQQQLVAIARAIAFDCKIIIMDEPTASLSSTEVKLLYEIIEKLKKAGVGIIYISHKLEEIFMLADRVSILRDGNLVDSGEISKYTQQELIRLMVGRELQFIPYRNDGNVGDVLFEAINLTNEPYFRNVSFQVREREILGITGLVGAGRSELAQSIFGLKKLQSGRMLLHGKTVDVKNAKDAIAKGISYIPEDRREQGLFMDETVMVNISSADMDGIKARTGLLSTTAERELAEGYIEKLQIKPGRTEINVVNMSGGNQQKVLIAKWLNTAPKLLIVDEVTSGVDIGVKTEIHRLLRELAKQGVAIVVISSDLPEILALSDNIMIMNKGTVASTLKTDEATQEKILALALAAEGI